MSVSAILWTISSLLLGYLVLLLLKRADTYLNDQSSKRKPEAPPRPEYKLEHKPEFIDMEFPDGVRGKISIERYSRNFWHNSDQYRGVGWTPPMKELFLLITQDYKNWEFITVSRSSPDDECPTEVECYSRGYNKYTHKSLNIKVYVKHEAYRHESHCISSLSLSDKQTSFVVAQAKCWRDVTYGEKLRRIENIKGCRRKRILLENQQKEATMITQYLENKDKA